MTFPVISLNPDLPYGVDSGMGNPKPKAAPCLSQDVTDWWDAFSGQENMASAVEVFIDRIRQLELELLGTRNDNDMMAEKEEEAYQRMRRAELQLETLRRELDRVCRELASLGQHMRGVLG